MSKDANLQFCTETLFLEKFGQKKKGNKTSSNMQNSMVMSPFSVFDPFRVNLNNIIKNGSLSWNVVLKLILICTIVMLTFSDFDQKYLFWANFVQKSQIVSLSWNLVSRITWLCRIQWCCSFLQFLTGNTFVG